MSNSKNGGKISPADGGLKFSKYFWLSIFGPLAVIAAVVGYLIITQSDDGPSATRSSTPLNQASSTYTDQVTGQWKAIESVCAELVKKEQGVIDQATLDSFSAAVSVGSKKIDTARKEIEAISPVPSEYRDKHFQLTASISSLEDYLAKLQALTGKKAADVKQEEFRPVDTAGSDAKIKTDLAVDEIGFLQRLPQVTFTLQTGLLTFYQSVWEKGVAAPPAPRTGVQPSSPGTAANPSLPAGAGSPDQTVWNFGASYVAGDPDGMSQYIIGQAISDFNAQSGGVYPFSSEILEGPTQQGGNYIYRVMYEFRIDTGPYLEDWTMVVSQQGSAYYITGVNLELRTEYADN